MKVVVAIILLSVTLLISFNAFLTYRAKRHSNKFVANIIKRIPLLCKVIRPSIRGWSIATFTTDKQLTELSNTDIPNNWFQIHEKGCSGVADPFLFMHREKYYLFFEYEYHKQLKKGADLAYAVSENGMNWKFQQKILKEPFHQSFPYVFQQDEEIYMLPESYQSNQVRLYKAAHFPEEWELDTVLFEGKRLVDTVFLEKDNEYFWITTNLESETLELYFSEGLKRPWKKHPMSPITSDPKRNRNAGAIFQQDGNYYRLAQDATKGYGSGVNVYRITDISMTSYTEEIVKEPLLFKDKGPIKDAIHHISFIPKDNANMIAVDGANFAIKSLNIM